MMPTVAIDSRKFRVGEISGEGSSWTVLVDDKKVRLQILYEATTKPIALLLRARDRVMRVELERWGDEDSYTVEVNGRLLVVRLEAETAALHRARSEIVEGPVLVKSPMAGKIASVKTSAGRTVEEGQALVVLEAMKMENEIAAPRKGIIKEIYVQPGKLTKPGDRLLLIE